MLRVSLSIILVLGAAAAFGRFAPSAPVIDGSTGRRLTSAELSVSGNVVVFVLDTSLSPAYVKGRDSAAHESPTHGSMVARVLRNHANVAVVGMPVEEGAEKRGEEVFQKALKRCLDFVAEHTEVRVLLNISLAFPEPDPETRRLIESLRGASAATIAAAGNESSDTPMYPAAYPSVIAVASADGSGRASHSNFGPHIDISASGEASLQELVYLPYRTRREIIETRGTSYAAPRVTATLAYILQKRPDWNADRALDFILSSALPIEDELYEQGRLGEGYLDVSLVKSRLHRPYFWIHRFLPVLSLSILGSISLVFIIMKKLPGLFIALLLWLAFFPLCFIIILALSRTLPAIRAGLTGGEGPYMFVSLFSTSACLLFLKFRPFDAAFTLLPPVTIVLLLSSAGISPAVKATVLGLLPPVAVALWEWRTRKVLTAVEDACHSVDTEELCEFIARAYEKHPNPRIRKKILELLLSFPAEDIHSHLARLTEEDRYGRGAASLLEAFTDRIPDRG